MSDDPAHNSFGAKNLLAYLWEHRRAMGPFFFWRITCILATVPFPILSQKIVDEAIPDRNFDLLWIYTGIGVGLLMVHIITARLGIHRLAVVVQTIIQELRGQVFQKLQFMNFGFLDSTQTGRLLSKYAFDTHHIEAATIPLISNVIPQGIRALCLILALTWVNPWLTLFCALMLPLFAVVRTTYFKKVRHSNRQVRLARETLTGRANEFISAIKLVRGFAQEPRVRGEMEDASDEYSDTREEQMRVNNYMGLMVFTMVTAFNLVAVSFGGILAMNDMLSVGAIIALVGALPIILSPINLFTQYSIQYMLGAESYRSIRELMNSGYVEKWHGTQRPDPLRGDVEFRGVSFRYSESDPVVLHDLSFSIRPGEHVAFVGPSGSGKSTLVNLLLGLYAPTDGEICIDGVPQADLNMRYLRRKSAIVMQDNILLSGTLLDNIRFGRPEASKAEVEEAARRSNALEFIEALPEGMNTRVGERGVSLSGGQRQRIAIARALLRDPRILILDEATSALDYESEALVQEALENLARDRTTLTIAHRLSTVRHAHRVVVLENGRIIESGTYDELADRPEGTFRAMLSSQT